MNIKSVASLTLAILATFHLQLTTGRAQGTAFTYQGRLNDGTNPATGIYDLQFALFNAASGGTQQSGTFTQLAQGVTNGLFTVTLDFGSFFPGADRWLEIGVRTNGGSSFTTLTPRQKFTATPYAITAGTVTGVIPSAALSGVYSGAVTMSNLSNVFAGNGTGLTNVNAVTLGGLSSASFWKTNGNTGANPTNGAFLGNADNLPLELRVNGARGLRLEPTPNVTEVNVIGGSVGNRVINGAFGATVFGGSFDGSTNHGNTVAGNLGTVSGGRQNSANNAETTVAGGRANTANGGNSTVSGGYANTANGNYSGIGGGRGNLISLGVDDGVISGGWNNLILTNAARGTVGGGFTNVVSAVDATIAGGSYNNAQGFASAIAGGSANTAGATFATVGGGNQNLVATNADYATLAGGVGNVITNAAAFATISGGKNNQAAAVEATVSGGAFNSALGFSSTVGGGGGNLASGDWSTIAGGRDNQLTNAPYATIGGGYQNVIQTNSDYATIGGGGGNTILANGHFATVPGGRNNTATNYAFAAGNRAKANHLGTFVWGDSADADFVSSGNNQFLIRAGGGVGINTNIPGNFSLAVRGNTKVDGSFVGGHAGNVISNGVVSGFIGGGGSSGFENRVGGNFGAIAGGVGNVASGSASFVAGETSRASGRASVALGWGTVSSSDGSVALGKQTIASGLVATAMGEQTTSSGWSSTAMGYLTRATNDNATAMGQGSIAGGWDSLAVGTFAIAAGNYSLAAGYYAQANHPGSFVWADSTSLTPFASTAANQFLVRATGGVGINTSSPQAPLHVWGRAIVNGSDFWDVNNTEGDFRVGSATHRFKIGVAQSGGGAGDVWMRAHGGSARLFVKTPGGTTFYSNEGQTTGVTMAPGGGSFTSLSDRNTKENFKPVNTAEVLEKVAALPLSNWNYKSQDTNIRHLGPMAQDFKAAFGLGESDTGITTIDADGVALAAIQGLNQKLEAENAELKARLEKLERLVESLAAKN